MGTTPGGLVYPEPTAPVRNGATDMRYFLEQLDQDPVEASLYKTGNNSMVNAAWYKMQWNGSTYEHGSGVEYGVNSANFGVLCSLGGRYYVEAVFQFPNIPVGRRGIGVGSGPGATPPLAPNSNFQNLTGFTGTMNQVFRISGTVQLESGGGYINGFIFQESGATITPDGSSQGLIVRRLRLGQPHA